MRNRISATLSVLVVTAGLAALPDVFAPPSATAGTGTFAPAASSADAEERASRTVRGSNDLNIMLDGSVAQQAVGLRLPAVAIPRSSAVTSARLQFTAVGTSSGAASFTIHGQASSSAAPFTTEDNDITARRRTTSKVSWTPPAWNTPGERGAAQRTPNLASIVQEIVNRDSWNSNDPMAFIITGNGRRTAEAWDRSTNGHWTLSVEWTSPTTPTTTTTTPTTTTPTTTTPVTTTPVTTTTPVSSPTPSPVPTPVPDPALIPYSADSYHKSVVAGAPVDAVQTQQFHAFMASHPEQAGTKYPVIKGVDGNKWGTPYAQGRSGDPVWRVRTIAGNNNSKNAILQTQGFRAPEWLGTAFTGTSDSPVAIMDVASGFTVFLTKASLVGDHLIDVESAGITWHSSNGLDYRSPRSNDARNFTSRGRISDAMVIRKDLVSRAIAHDTDLGHVLQLFIVESSTAAGYTHPMVGTESDKFGWGAEGQRLAIRADIDLTTRGLSPAGLAIARTLQRHGMYIGDNAGGASSLKAEQDSAARPVWGGLLRADSLAGITWSDFVVLQS